MFATGSLLLLLMAQSSAAPPRRDFTSSDLADAAEHLTGRRAHLSDEIRLLAGRRLAGPAITMRIVPDDSASLRGEGLAAIQFIEAAHPGAVVVVAMEGPKAFAVFGSTFATLARSRGLAGFIIEGAVRGLPEIRRLGFPTFARGTVAGSAGGHYRITATNVTVTIGGVEVSPGDLVVGDEDGVAVAPKERRDEVAALALKLRREKEELLPLITRFRSYTDALAEQRRRAGSRP
jgi:regulator of RNase E activity RraA